MVPQRAIVHQGAISLLTDAIRKCVHELSSLAQSHFPMVLFNPVQQRRSSPPPLAKYGLFHIRTRSLPNRMSNCGYRDQQKDQKTRQRNWEEGLSRNGRFLEHSLAALEDICVVRVDGGVPALLSRHASAGQTGGGVGDVAAALRWASIVVEWHGSRSHELVQLVR